MSLLLIVAGLIFLWGAVWHEWWWYRQQRHCVYITGRIIDEVEDEWSVTTRWKLEYEPLQCFSLIRDNQASCDCLTPQAVPNGATQRYPLRSHQGQSHRY